MKCHSPHFKQPSSDQCKDSMDERNANFLVENHYFEHFFHPPVGERKTAEPARRWIAEITP